ncbi:hypothetical protein DPV69_16855 [Pedobacter chitinilyticus]|uniref:Uncharacterized protein n=2 Tax=Pedobacter chitinilyticus TaxID=2233776 RepID=A0A3S3SSF2_9SPHI|nr:hypothetical protein DPV69_16855 [Pedobacter chitinilyticus]
MTSRGKKIFLTLSVVVPFVIYSVIYYAPMIKNAPFQEKYFVSLEYKWGTGTQLENSYNSATGEFKYLNKNDSLVKSNVKLSQRDIKYLDSIADVQGFWNLPNIIANNEADVNNPKQLRYFIKFNYQKKSKEVTYLPNFSGSERMKGAIGKMQKEIELTLIDKENAAR